MLVVWFVRQFIPIQDYPVGYDGHPILYEKGLVPIGEQGWKKSDKTTNHFHGRRNFKI